MFFLWNKNDVISHFFNFLYFGYIRRGKCLNKHSVWGDFTRKIILNYEYLLKFFYEITLILLFHWTLGTIRKWHPCVVNFLQKVWPKVRILRNYKEFSRKRAWYQNNVFLNVLLKWHSENICFCFISKVMWQLMFIWIFYGLRLFQPWNSFFPIPIQPLLPSNGSNKIALFPIMK